MQCSRWHTVDRDGCVERSAQGQNGVVQQSGCRKVIPPSFENAKIVRLLPQQLLTGILVPQLSISVRTEVTAYKDNDSLKPASQLVSNAVC